MQANPDVVYLWKGTGETLESTTHNRTAQIIGGGDGIFTVSVTERDYIDDPSGQRITVVFRDDFDAIDVAREELKRQVDQAIEHGYVINTGSPSY